MSQPGQAQFNDGFYEILPSPGKGNGAFALKDIKAGTIILADTARFEISKPLDQINDKVVHSAVSRLNAAQQQQFYALPIIPGAAPPNQPLKAISHHRFNHSCRPNCDIDKDFAGRMACVVRRDVVKGEELTFSYNSCLAFMTTAQRKQILKQFLSRPCKCEVCLAPLCERHVSDLRRNLLRHLLVFMKKKEPRELRPLLDKKFCTTMVEQEHGNGWGLGRAHLLAIFLAEAEGIISMPQLGSLYAELLGKTATIARIRKFADIPTPLLVRIKAWIPQVTKHWNLIEKAEAEGDTRIRGAVQVSMAFAELVVAKNGRLGPLAQMFAMHRAH